MIQTGNGYGSVLPVPPKPTADLTSQQRSQRIDALVNQVNAVTIQVNTLTKILEAHAKRVDGAYVSLERASERFDQLERHRTFWQRLRWIVTGR